MPKRNINRLYKKYNEKVIPLMKEKFGYTNNLAVPKIIKVTINSGFGRFKEDKALMDELLGAITIIAGQKPMINLAKQAISAFKIRQGMPVGLSVTLRGERMYDFIDRFISIVLPRTRDFRGLNTKSVDRQGNFTYGVKEHIVFPEITTEYSKHLFGLEVCVTTNAGTREKGLELLRLMGFPFKEE